MPGSIIETIADYWDRHAAEYDALPGHGINKRADREAWKAVLAPLLGDKPLKLLDFGCGTGALTRVLAEMGLAVLGIDLSRGMIEAAARSNPPANAVFRQCPLEEVKDLFDGVVARHVFWSLPNPAAAMTALKSRLRPGGRLIIIDGAWYEGARCKEAIEDDYPDAVKACLPLLHRPRPAADRALLSELGFAEIAVTESLLDALAASGRETTGLESFDRRVAQFLVTGVNPASE